MNAIAIIGVVTSVVQAAQLAIEAGKSAAPFIQILARTFTGNRTEISEEELQSIQDQVDNLSTELQAPLPPEESAPSTS